MSENLKETFDNMQGVFNRCINHADTCVILKYIFSRNQIVGSIRGNIYDDHICHIGKHCYLMGRTKVLNVSNARSTARHLLNVPEPGRRGSIKKTKSAVCNIML